MRRLPFLIAMGLVALLVVSACGGDGQAGAGKIAFVSTRDGNEEIYVVNGDGTGLTNLTNDPASDRFPAWSPDGSRLIFISNREGDIGFYVMNADGSEVTRISDSVADTFPSWSPDGTKIAFVSSRDVNAKGAHEMSIYVMDSRGSNHVRLTDPPQAAFGNASAQDSMPAWSPNGSKIAFASSRAGRGDYDVYLMSKDGTDLTNLTGSPESVRFDPVVARAWDDFPKWSPDGSRIAFVSRRGGNVDVYLMNADGSNQANLTNSPEEDGSLGITWSPDGDHIAFTRYANADAPPQLWVMKADGSAQTRLTDNLTDATLPAWSPAP